MNELIIEAGRSERQYWRDLWKYRELFLFLAWRDLLIRYKQTAVGIVWAIIRPALTVLALTMITKVGKLPTGGLPPALFTAAAILPWQFFAAALSESGNSLVINSNLISKVYFPRLIVPASSIITSFVDFLITAAFVTILLFWYHFLPPIMIWWLPVFVLMVFVVSLGAGLWIAALMVKYRDFRFIVPFIVSYGVLISPVVLKTSSFSGAWRLVYSINPLVGIIDGFRWCILGGLNTLYWPGLMMSVLGTVLLLTSGIWYFRKTERTFADII
ncbi:MAG TPA: ABC transporter permease [Verrucomicrobiae bacterium]